ncbi:hypothetical protein STBHUCCB_43540 [Salmonella enterica subsp. enterica serovar Typhi str. P-stx-12]|nr:hypothetical protein STBHUCCB_43540 [Salmonella enterica subsp. enterica serovar Typhi str. P-stx-12]AXR54739.1 hypothetical protein CJP42_0469 [Salmonella enterica subsp. enterica serovar Typhi]
MPDGGVNALSSMYGKPGGVQRHQALTLCAIRQFIASELQENV